MHNPYMLFIALTLVGIYSLPIEDNGDQDFSDEQWDYLTGEEHDYDDIDLDDYFDDYIEENFSNVYNNRTLWRWVGNEIPYEFDAQNRFWTLKKTLGASPPSPQNISLRDQS